MQYHGQMALQTAILVAFTQIIPEHQVQIMGVIKTRVKVRVHWCLSFVLGCILIVVLADPNGLPHSIYNLDFRWLPMPLDCHPIWLAGWLGIPTLL